MPKSKRTILPPTPSGRITPLEIKEVVRAVHIVPDEEGGWVVKQGGGKRIKTRFSKRNEAVSYGERLSHERQSSVFIHDIDGHVVKIANVPTIGYTHEGGRDQNERERYKYVRGSREERQSS